MGADFFRVCALKGFYDGGQLESACVGASSFAVPFGALDIGVFEDKGP